MNSVQNWHTFTLSTAPENGDACSELLREVGCDGVEVRDVRVRFDESEDATLEILPQTDVIGYLHGESSHAEPQLRLALDKAGVNATLRVEELASQDWANNWREHFPPLRAGRFLVAPPWSQEEPRDGELMLRIDPGLAFGTGQHPTTRMCLELLSKHVPALLDAATLLDVGCGSGILSIAAKLLRPDLRVVSCDPDPFCTEATLENARENKVHLEVHERAGAAWTSERFDLVVANLMSALLISIADELSRASKPNGVLIVSGISQPRANEVEAALNAAGFQTLHSRVESGDVRGDGYVEKWAAFALRNGIAN